MNVRRLGLAALFVISIAVAYCSGAAAPAPEGEGESLALRSARAQLRLAELTLQKAQAMNKKVSLTFAEGTMMLFADDVELAKMQVANASKAEGADPLQAYLQRQELGVRLAEAKLKRANDTNKRAAGVVSPIDLERVRLGVEIAKLQLERGRSLVNASPDAKLQYQIEVLSDELARVKQETYLLGQNRLSQF